MWKVSSKEQTGLNRIGAVNAKDLSKKVPKK